jgi:prevent-host-death family protein
LIDTVNATDEEIMITKNGRPAAVLVSPEEFESLKETVAVRSDSALMQEIKKGLRALRMRRAKLYTLDELFR